MSTPARKVALINDADYPKDQYWATWIYSVSGSPIEGYRWRASIDSRREPVGYHWQGKLYKEWPEGVARPVYPPPPEVTQRQYLLMSQSEQAIVRERQDAWRAACAAVYEAHPKARYCLEDTLGAVTPEDVDPALKLSWDLATGAAVSAMVAYKAEPSEERARALGDARAAENAAMEAVARAMRDLADTQAQQWALAAMPKYRIQPQPEAGHAMTLGPAGMLWDALSELARWLVRPLLALSYSTTIRSNRLTQIINAIDGGAGAGKLRFYDGARPSVCGTATTLLAEITCSDPCASESGQVLTFDNTPALTDASANAGGTMTWFRAVDSTNACCMDGNCGTAGSDVNWNSVVISAGQAVTLENLTITAGNG